MSRFFAATASAPHSSGAAREMCPKTALVGWLTPCASRLREPHRTARLLALSVVGWRSRDGSKPRRTHARPSHLSAERRLPPHQGTHPRRRLGRRLLDAQSTFHRLDRRPHGRMRLVRVRWNGHAPRLAPVRSSGASPPCQGWDRPLGLLLARLVRLAAPLAHAEKMLLTDFCNRPFDTRTRGTFDFRAHSKLRRPPCPDLPDRSPAERDSCGVEPPCGNPTPDGHAFDGAQPASASSSAAALGEGAEHRSKAALP